MKKLICSTFREGYGIDQIRRTMTAGELINFLAQYDEDTPEIGRASCRERV